MKIETKLPKPQSLTVATPSEQKGGSTIAPPPPPDGFFRPIVTRLMYCGSDPVRSTTGFLPLTDNPD